MELNIKITGRKTTVKYKGHSYEHKTAFLNKLSFKDFLTYVTDNR